MTLLWRIGYPLHRVALSFVRTEWEMSEMQVLMLQMFTTDSTERSLLILALYTLACHKVAAFCFLSNYPTARTLHEPFTRFYLFHLLVVVCLAFLLLVLFACLTCTMLLLTEHAEFVPTFPTSLDT